MQAELQTHISCSASFAPGLIISVQGAQWQPEVVKSQTSACTIQLGPSPSVLVTLHLQTEFRLYRSGLTLVCYQSFMPPGQARELCANLRKLVCVISISH